MMHSSKSPRTVATIFVVMMVVVVVSFQYAQVYAFSASPASDRHHGLNHNQHLSSTRTVSRSDTALNAYVPDGLTPEQYEKIKQAEQRKIKGKNLGALGPKGFKSRSMQAWQQSYEKGQTSHTFAPIGYRDALKKGQIKKSDVPYMVRGGSWDNSDVKGSKRLKWTKADREYANGGYKKEQSASILGSGPGIDWTGTRPRDVNLANGRIPGFS